MRWTPQEDAMLLRLVDAERRGWPEIGQRLKRTVQAAKVRYYSIRQGRPATKRGAGAISAVVFRLPPEIEPPAGFVESLGLPPLAFRRRLLALYWSPLGEGQLVLANGQITVTGWLRDEVWLAWRRTPRVEAQLWLWEQQYGVLLGRDDEPSNAGLVRDQQARAWWLVDHVTAQDWLARQAPGKEPA